MKTSRSLLIWATLASWRMDAVGAAIKDRGHLAHEFPIFHQCGQDAHTP